METELQQTQRELQQSQLKQAAMQAEIAMLKSVAQTAPIAQQDVWQQDVLAHRVGLLWLSALLRSATIIQEVVAEVAELSLKSCCVLLSRTVT